MIFKGTEHKRIFTREITRYKERSIPCNFLAALFLLTANKNLWRRASRKINQFNIDWKFIDIRNVGVQEYALHKLAKDIYLDAGGVTVTNLYEDGFSDQTIKLIYSAIDIRRHGMALFKTDSKRSENYV